MVTRRRVVIALGAGIIAAPLKSISQQPTKIWRIGFLVPGEINSKPDEPNPYAAAFLRGMEAAGHVFGMDYTVEVRSADGDRGRLPALAAELVRLKFDILIPVTPVAVLAAHKASASVPIVCIGAHDPVGVGMAASLARPGGNLTGLKSFYGDLIPKHLELVKSFLPKASRVAILSILSPEEDDAAMTRRIMDAGKKLGLRLQVVRVGSAGEFSRAFASMTQERASAFIAIADVEIAREGRHIAELALTHRFPSFFASRENVVFGGLASYGEDFIDLFVLAAKYVSKIMKGARPGDLPMEQPTKFYLAINRKTARALHLPIPQELLLRADEVID